MRRIALTAAVLALVVVALYAATLSQAGFECEACVEWEGRQSCRVVVGPTQAEARSGAISNACATLTRGVTEVLRCGGTEPVSVQCRER
jgi:hypothetical protein